MALITFTSSFGSGGEKIAQAVADTLGLEFYYDRKLQLRARSMGISNEEIEGFDEKAPGILDRLFTYKPALYLDLLGAVVYDVASTGKGVIVGHGAQFFLQDFDCALHVMVHASEATRSRLLMQEHAINEAAALDMLRRMDKRINDFIRYAFGRDWGQPSRYDMVINLDKIGPELAEKLIVEVAESDKVKACSLGALEKMEFSSLERRIDAALIKNNLSSPFAPILIDVPSKGHVHLSGLIPSDEQHRKIVAVVQGVPGVSLVVSDIRLVFV
jgi:cytidylate kinase